ncbi:MAG TPA: 23S rRNA (guanosine(2251)-2'-O)-methyltransferase RlmB [Solirubrobacteraceae bacterium]|jgi:23S rRNA (guanosine2251-2'-O)-methyltransferase
MRKERGNRHVLYGRNPVREALRAGRRRVHRVWATSGAAKEPWLEDPEIVAADELERLCGSSAHQGVCAETDPFPYAGARELLARESPLIVALDEVQDPQNLGAIARTAEAAGASGLVIPERRSAEVTPAAAKASAGAVEHLPIARVRNVADFLAEAKAAGCWCYGADAGGTARYDEPDYEGGVVLVVGAEGKGLRPRVASACDVIVSIPLLGRIESLNVSAAAAIVLYEISRCRGFA